MSDLLYGHEPGKALYFYLIIHVILLSNNLSNIITLYTSLFIRVLLGIENLLIIFISTLFLSTDI